MKCPSCNADMESRRKLVVSVRLVGDHASSKNRKNKVESDEVIYECPECGYREQRETDGC